MKSVVLSSLILGGLFFAGITSPVEASAEVSHLAKKVSRHVEVSISVQNPNYYQSSEEDYSDFDDNGAWADEDTSDYRGLHWLSVRYGHPIPRDAVGGGFQPYPPAKLYVCRAFYNGGLHPGKLYKGQCNIGWGGSEVVLDHYQVLTSYYPLYWVRSGYGMIPPRAVQGGYQYDGPLYVCRAKYRGGWHPGKIVKGQCNIGWGGREVTVPIYDVLTR